MAGVVSLFCYRLLPNLLQFTIHYHLTEGVGEINCSNVVMEKAPCCKFMFVRVFIASENGFITLNIWGRSSLNT
jgi:hypothetical protein